MRYIRGSMAKRLFITLFSFFTLSCGFAQNPITDLVILVEDSVYRMSEGVLHYRGEPHLLFGYTDENPSAEIRVYPIDDLRDSNLELNPTSAYELTDSIIWMGEYYRFRVRFSRLSENDFLSFILKTDLKLSLLLYKYQKRRTMQEREKTNEKKKGVFVKPTV